MGINPSDFRKYVIRPTLKKLGKWSPPLENLLLGSAAQASQLGAVLVSNQGLGVYGVNREAHLRVWDDFLAFDPDMASAVRGLASQRQFLSQPDMELATNFSYATAIAWAIIAHNQVSLPEDANNLDALAQCWESCFHTSAVGNRQQFVDNYRALEATLGKAIAA